MGAEDARREHAFWRWLVSERVVLSVIVLNAIVLFVRAFPGWHDDAHGILWRVDYACTVYFVAEMAIKITLVGWPRFWKNGWNKLDLLVVVLSAPHLLAPFVPLADLGVVLVLRIARVARMMRLMHFIPDRERLWAGLKRALRASVGVVIALLLYNFVLGLCACYLFRDTGSSYFEDPLVSLYSVFKVFTIEGWHEIPDSVAASAETGAFMAVLVRLFFMFSVATGGLLGISLANAVFVDEMAIDNTIEIEGHIEKLRVELVAARVEAAANADRLQRTLDALTSRIEEADPGRRSP